MAGIAQEERTKVVYEKVVFWESKVEDAEVAARLTKIPRIK